MEAAGMAVTARRTAVMETAGMVVVTTTAIMETTRMAVTARRTAKRTDTGIYTPHRIPFQPSCFSAAHRPSVG